MSYLVEYSRLHHGGLKKQRFIVDGDYPGTGLARAKEALGRALGTSDVQIYDLDVYDSIEAFLVEGLERDLKAAVRKVSGKGGLSVHTISDIVANVCGSGSEAK